MDDTGDLSVSCAEKRTRGARPYPIVAARCDRWLGWHAWRSVTRGGVCIAADIAHRSALSRARLHFVCRLFGDPRHAGVAGADAAGVDSETLCAPRCRDG